ncbi:O-acyltransferase like protein [Aplysia californica]|uniref:O-acyltransferase like protein n=1 Tax=Aplysia californica TaxID=6500 RepID=A0ABM1A7R4_APLCA|nr:O-acyltransferase like protein [Aplysia californica]
MIKDALGDDTTDTGFRSNNGTEEKAWGDIFRNASSACFQDVARTVQAFIDEESWAVEMLDAWGKPGPSLTRGRFQFVGNYDQCRDARAPPLPGEERQGFYGRYCVLGLNYGQESTSSTGGIPASIKNLQIGSCIPDTCNEQELTQLVTHALEMVNMTSQLSPGPMECRDDHRGGSTFTTLAANHPAGPALFLRLLQHPENPVYQRGPWRHRLYSWTPLLQYDVDHAASSLPGVWALSRGFLVSYLKLKPWMEKGRRVNWRLFYFHRIWRLTPPNLLTLVFFTGFLKFFGSGETWFSTMPVDEENCEKYVWTNVLYVNNIVHTESMCMGQTWYLATDMQFYLVSPLLFVPFYYNMYAGLAVCGTVLLSSWIVTGVLSLNRGWVASDFAMGHTNPQADRFTDYYLAPNTRVGPFVIGILAGYLMARHGGQIAIQWYVVVIGWAVAVATGLAVVYGIHGDITAKDPSSTEVAALYNALSKSVWAVAISWVVIACASGYGGPVNWLLSWKPLIVLSRLSYLGYLIHPYIMYIYFGNQGAAFLLNDSNMEMKKLKPRKSP